MPGEPAGNTGMLLYEAEDLNARVLAAHRAGIKTILLPKWNEKDLVDIPEKVRKDIEFHFMEKMIDVLKIAIKE